MPCECRLACPVKFVHGTMVWAYACVMHAQIKEAIPFMHQLTGIMRRHVACWQPRCCLRAASFQLRWDDFECDNLQALVGCLILWRLRLSWMAPTIWAMSGQQSLMTQPPAPALEEQVRFPALLVHAGLKKYRFHAERHPLYLAAAGDLKLTSAVRTSTRKLRVPWTAALCMSFQAAATRPSLWGNWAAALK